jgi:hypothetical protein
MKSKPSPAFVGALSLNAPAQPANDELLITQVELLATILSLHDRLFRLGAMHDSPCFACGYDGPGYYQPETHPCATLHHKLAQLRR